MVTFHDLNWEIIENVVACGCDDELERDLEPHSRRRKEFAATFRGVCKVWKEYIDESPGAHMEFWIARANLNPSRDPDPRLEPSFARQLITFQYTISHSEGCDLIINFRFASDEDLWNEDTVDLPPESEELIRLKLIIYAMNYIIPYQEQIISLSFRSESLQACKHFVEVLMKLTSAQRLSKLILLHGSSQNLSLNEIGHAAGVPGWIPLVSRRRELPTPPFKLPSLSTCNTLEISHPAWLSEVEYPSSSISRRLRILLYTPLWKSNLSQTLIENSALRTSLVSLSIEWAATEALAPVTTLTTLSQISLPNLSRFVAQVALPDTQFEDFFSQIVCPCLREVQLLLSARDDSIESTPIDVAPPYSLRMPGLISLFLKTDMSWPVLRMLGLFNWPSVETLKISVRYTSAIATADALSHHNLGSFLSHFQPVELVLHNIKYDYLLLFLNNLKLNSVYSLDITFSDRNEEKNSQRPNLSLPNLAILRLRCNNLKVAIDLISSLRSTALQTLSVTTFRDHSNRGETPVYLRTDHLGVLLPSVHSIRLILCYDDILYIRNLSGLAPNTRVLSVDIYPLGGSTSSDLWKGGYLAITQLCFGLMPGYEGVPFRYLENFKGGLPMAVLYFDEAKDSDEQNLDESASELLRRVLMLPELLKSREIAGAVPLQLLDLSVRLNDGPDDDDDPDDSEDPDDPDDNDPDDNDDNDDDPDADGDDDGDPDADDNDNADDNTDTPDRIPFRVSFQAVAATE